MDSIKESAQDSLAASGCSSETLNLLQLQSKIKCDPEGYESELVLVYRQFKASLDLFERQTALNFTSLSGMVTNPSVAKDLGDRAMFLSHVTQLYPKYLSSFPRDLVQFLKSTAPSLPSGLRVNVTQALILLNNRKMIDIVDILVLFTELQTLRDKNLKKLAFTHVIQSIKRMNQKHKNDPKNRELQNILYRMLQQDEEAKAKVALVTLCDLHRRRVWIDDRTANAICMACFHSSSRVMIAALSFLLDSEKIEDVEDSDDSGREDGAETQQPHIVLNKEAIYKANNKGTSSSKKKKKAKLQRIVRSMKKKQRLSSENNHTNYFSPLNHLKDAQGFAEKLFSRLQSYNGRFQVKMILLKVIARTVGLHSLILLNFYPYLQNYVQPHQRDVISLLAAAADACHDMVPPDAVEPLFKQIVNQFVHDRSSKEAISVGLNVVSQICLRMPLLMTEDLLQDLVLYRKSNEKAVSSAAHKLISMFKAICPSLLNKKDRGRPTNPKARPKAFGEVNVFDNIPDVELLDQEVDIDEDINEERDSDSLCEDYGSDTDSGSVEKDDNDKSDVDSEDESDGSSDGKNERVNDCTSDDEHENEVSDEHDHANHMSDLDDVGDEAESVGEEAVEELEELKGIPELDTSRMVTDPENSESKAQKRKFSDFEVQLKAADRSLRALKKFAGQMAGSTSSIPEDGILSNEDFQRIKELKAKEDARTALAQHGFKLPSSEQLSTRRVDAAKLEANIKQKLTKEQRLALLQASREERGKYQARTAMKQKKTGGLSNQQKEHKKVMPLAAKRARIAKSRQEKKKLRKHSGKQFRGRKAWK